MNRWTEDEKQALWTWVDKHGRSEESLRRFVAEQPGWTRSIPSIKGHLRGGKLPSSGSPWSLKEKRAVGLWVAEHGTSTPSLRRFLEENPGWPRTLQALERWSRSLPDTALPVEPFKCERLRFPEFLTEEQKIQTKLLAETSLGAAAQYVAMVRRWRQDPPPPARDLRVKRSRGALKTQQERYETDAEYRAKKRAKSLEYYYRRKESAS